MKCPPEQCPPCPAKTSALTQKVWEIAERTTNLQDRLLLRYKLPIQEVLQKTAEWQNKKIRQVKLTSLSEKK